MKGAKKLVTALAALVVLAAGFIVVYNIGLNKTEAVNSMTVIQGSIKDLGKLVTSEYVYTLTSTSSKPNKTVAGFELPFTGSKVIFSYSGEVKAGFDFSGIDVSVDKAGKSISVKLPKAEIISSEVDFDSLVVYDERNSPFNSFSFEDMNLSVANLQADGEKAAEDSGLYERAAENAKTLIRSALASCVDLDEYSLEFR